MNTLLLIFLLFLILAILVILNQMEFTSNNPNPNPNPDVESEQMVSAYDNIQGTCADTHFGCCPDGVNSKDNIFGSNCPTTNESII